MAGFSLYATARKFHTHKKETGITIHFELSVIKNSNKKKKKLI